MFFSLAVYYLIKYYALKQLKKVSLLTNIRVESTRKPVFSIGSILLLTLDDDVAFKVLSCIRTLPTHFNAKMSFCGIASIKRASEPDSYIKFLGSIETFSNYLNVVLK